MMDSSGDQATNCERSKTLVSYHEEESGDKQGGREHSYDASGTAMGMSFHVDARVPSRDAVALTLVANGTTTATVAVGVNHTPIERFAAETIQRHFRALTGQTPPLQVLPDEQLPPDTILVGTPNSHPAIEVANAVGELRLAGLGNEGYHIRLIRSGGSERVLIGANMATGALYGSVAFVEALIRRQTGLSPVDIDVEVSSVNALTLDTLDERSIPFYPIRATLEVEEVDWLGRHRVNVSGAEGVWSGTGNDDGIGAAFQYVLGYEQLQDRERFVRERTISQLQIRTRLLSERGIDSFLFMYLTGEPTNALISARPDLLGPAVLYGGARNGDFYRPFCWSNPDTLSLFADLSREIVRTYPDLSGFHLRAWGDETRACKCPLCGQNDAAGQELLWQIAYTVINAAREVRPDFRLLLSGYDQSWFQDPNFTHLNRLPPGSIVVQKWGGDGEPTIDPLIEPDLLRAVANSGHKLLVLSHDVEEVQPLWMLEGELFQQGVRRYADNPTIRGLGGFTLQGEIGMGLLDKRISAKVNWLPSVDVAAFTTNALSARYGSDAAPHLRDALFGNGRALSDFFTDYGGILTFTGGYRHGSAYQASRLWNLYGARAITDIVTMPDADTVTYALRRMTDLSATQSSSTQAMRRAALIASPDGIDTPLRDAVVYMEMWDAYFRSRLALVKAVWVGGTEQDIEAVSAGLNESSRHSATIRSSFARIEQYLALIQGSSVQSKQRILDAVDEEIAALGQVDPNRLIRVLVRQDPTDPTDPTEPNDPDPIRFDIEGFINAPSPFGDGGTYFVYTLTLDADAVEINVYTANGRIVRRLRDLPVGVGYQEYFWDGADDDGRKLANGVYYYRMISSRRNETRRAIGKFAILR